MPRLSAVLVSQLQEDAPIKGKLLGPENHHTLKVIFLFPSEPLKAVFWAYTAPTHTHKFGLLEGLVISTLEGRSLVSPSLPSLHPPLVGIQAQSGHQALMRTIAKWKTQSWLPPSAQSPSAGQNKCPLNLQVAFQGSRSGMPEERHEKLWYGVWNMRCLVNVCCLFYFHDYDGFENLIKSVTFLFWGWRPVSKSCFGGFWVCSRKSLKTLQLSSPLLAAFVIVLRSTQGKMCPPHRTSTRQGVLALSRCPTTWRMICLNIVSDIIFPMTMTVTENNTRVLLMASLDQSFVGVCFVYQVLSSSTSALVPVVPLCKQIIYFNFRVKKINASTIVVLC